jgi:hypothetical protein
MAQAFKCDKCSSLFNGESKKIFANPLVFMEKNDAGSLEARMNYDESWDLCDKCYSLLTIFIKVPLK